jgi:outer membrane receptor protein involved in Fe transport
MASKKEREQDRARGNVRLMLRCRRLLSGLPVLVYLSLAPRAAFAQAAPAQPPPAPPTVAVTVDVIGTTPLPGVDVTLDKMPSPVQTAIARDLDEAGALDLSAFLNRRMNGVYVNETQGNPFQPDVNYRGYTASPLLGTPQGLSIFMDGVRLNQPFGEVVSWDLIPRLAIASLTLIPGSNPLFGLNTLGGALSIQTKDGHANPGTSVQATYGSNQRRNIEFEHGGYRSTGLQWYFAGNLFAEDGWRDASPSDVHQIFGKLGWHGAKTEIDLSSSFADTSLTGNGLQDQRLLAQRYASVYTSPDQTDNRAGLINLGWRVRHNPVLTFSGNAYYRDIRTHTLNGDINEDSLDQSIYQPSAAERAVLATVGITGVPASGLTAANTPFPSLRCIANALLREEPGEKCNGLLNHTGTSQRTAGAAAQATRLGSLGRSKHQLTVGAAFDRSTVGFTQTGELGYLNPDRTVTGVGAFGDGVTGGNVDGEPYDTRVDLDGTIHTLSAYGTDTLTAGAWNVTLSARVNRIAIDNRDRIRPGGVAGSLDGSYVFTRFNPAAGLTYMTRQGVNLYAGYSEGNRAPTSIELGCADPNQPCKLPNAMAGDPPLDQVVTRTVEAGVRGGTAAGAHLSWKAGFFITRNDQDILFVSSPQTGFGYFKNFGETRRQGIELGISGHVGRVRAGGGYTWMAATYQSAETVNGAGNSTNDLAAAGTRGFDGTIAIAPGNRMPLIPRHTFKLFADIELTPRLSLDLDLVAISGSFARGNENNQHQPDGLYYLGPGAIPGYGVLNLGGHLRVTRWLQIVAQISNVLDQRYDTAALLGPAGFTGAGAFSARSLPAVNASFPVPQTTFLAPGAPRLAWIGTRLRL